MITSAKVKELVDRFALAGVVLVGHCAGTVSALYAASACSDECKGLILLDPYFHLPQAVRPKLRRGLSEWALHSCFGGLLSNVYDRLRSIRRYLKTNAPPQNANVPLLACWKKLAATGLPILLCKAPSRKATGTKPRVGEFDYLQHVLQLAGSRSKVAVELIEGTDHSFANRAGRLAVCQRTEAWLHSNLPLRSRKASRPLERSQTLKQTIVLTLAIALIACTDNFCPGKSKISLYDGSFRDRNSV